MRQVGEIVGQLAVEVEALLFGELEGHRGEVGKGDRPVPEMHVGRRGDAGHRTHRERG